MPDDAPTEPLPTLVTLLRMMSPNMTQIKLMTHITLMKTLMQRSVIGLRLIGKVRNCMMVMVTM